MALTMYCPFLVTDYKDKRGVLRIRCERAVIDFADAEEWRDFVCTYCGSPQGWKCCTVAQSIWKHYEKED